MNNKILLTLILLPFFLSSQSSMDIRLDVPMIEQGDRNNCWEASLAMIISWRQNASTLPEDITSNSEFLNQWCPPNVGLDPDHTEIFHFYGLTVDKTLVAHSPKWFFEILQKNGPIWVAVDISEMDSPEVWPHAMVITGISGDGSPNNTWIYINNPWGKEEEFTFVEFEKRLGRLVANDGGFALDSSGTIASFNDTNRIEKPVYFVYP